eukprot:jgi/Phyca11/133236/e_gw1.380.2.1
MVGLLGAFALLFLLSIATARLFISGVHRPKHSFGRVPSPLSVGFIHPDFGIGGAENLVVNAMLALQVKGVKVSMFTAHHDPTHCFEETRGDGPLSKCIFVYGDWFPCNIFGRLHALCTVIRIMFVTLVVTVKHLNDVDAFFVDQLSITVPFLRAFGKPVFFFGHFPDKVQANTNGSAIKGLYRIPFDYLEEVTTFCSDIVVANSKFSRKMFQITFPRSSWYEVGVLYPPVDVAAYVDFTPMQHRNPNLFVSLNRFERRKDILIAIKALAIIQQKLPSSEFATIKLVIAGGYEPNNAENLEHLQELQHEVLVHDLDGHVEFCTSVSDATKKNLLATARAILYTPSNEHFGIVPVEAMALSTPVIAVNSGGPMETVENGKTGFLCESTAESFADAMLQLLGEANRTRAEAMGRAGKDRALRLFSLEKFSDHLIQLIESMY